MEMIYHEFYFLLILIKHQAEETVGEISSEVLRELILGPGLGMALGKE